MRKFLGGHAAEVYAQSSGGNELQSLLPRSQFRFTVEIQHLNPDATASNPYTTTVLTRIAGVDMPSHVNKTSTGYQYNRKRIIQTGIEYNPISITAYDTKDAEIEKFVKLYHAYYYAGVNSPSDKKYVDDITNMDFNAYASLTGTNIIGERNFIKEIRIFRDGSDDGNFQDGTLKKHKHLTTIFNPMIQTLDTDSLSYSSSDVSQYKLSFVYEGYDISTQGITDKIGEVSTDFRIPDDTFAQAPVDDILPAGQNAILRGEALADQQAAERAIADFNASSYDDAIDLVDSGTIGDGTTVEVPGVGTFVGTTDDEGNVYLDNVGGNNNQSDAPADNRVFETEEQAIAQAEADYASANAALMNATNVLLDNTDEYGLPTAAAAKQYKQALSKMEDIAAATGSPAAIAAISNSQVAINDYYFENGQEEFIEVANEAAADPDNDVSPEGIALARDVYKNTTGNDLRVEDIEGVTLGQVENISDNQPSQSYKQTTTGTISGLIESKVMDTPEYQQILADNPPVTDSTRSQMAAEDKAMLKYKEKVLLGEIDPPAEAKAPNYSVTNDQGQAIATPTRRSKNEIINDKNAILDSMDEIMFTPDGDLVDRATLSDEQNQQLDQLNDQLDDVNGELEESYPEVLSSVEVRFD